MAITQNTYTGNGSTVLYSFTFPYLETSDIKVSVNGVNTTAYTLANATTIQFNAAPTNGAAIRIYRQTDDSALAATFYPGSSIRSSDLNDNFTQNLYVTQESSNNASSATTTANSALSTANTAISTANSAVSTANSAVSTANAASSNAASAVSTANTASSTASAAVATANTATANASAAVTTANTAAANASAAVSTANTASTNASAAVATANTASSNASTALSTANTALSTANAASSTAASAVSTANTASSNAAAALNAVANSVQYQLVAAVANIPASPSNGDAIEIANSTGIESFSPLANRPAGFVGDTGLSVRMQYSSAGSTWNWLNYFSNDSDTRYLKKSGGTLTGALTLNADPTQNLQAATKQYVDNVANAGGLPLTGGTMTGQILGDNSTSPTTPGYAFDGDPNTGMYRPGADELALATGGTARLTIDPAGAVAITNSLSVGGQAAVVTNDARLTDTRTPTDGTVTDAKVAANAAIAGTKISPDFGTQNVTTSGNITVTNQGDIRLGEATANGSNYVALQAPASLAADVTYTLPSADGTSGQVLSTNGSGTLSWATAAAGGASVTTSDTPPATPNDGDLWYDSAGGRTYVYYQDPNGSQWVDASPQGGGGSGTSITTGNTTAEVIDTGSDGRFVVTTEGTEALRVDSSRRLLVGTTSSTTGASSQYANFQVIGNGSATADRGAIVNLGHSAASSSITTNELLGQVLFTDNAAGEYGFIGCYADANAGSNDYPSRLVFATTADGAASPTERMRIRNNGEILFGGITSVATFNQGVGFGDLSSTTSYMRIGHNSTGATYSYILFGFNAGDIGSITQNSAGTAVAYNTTSDYRLKENVTPLTGATNRLKQLPVHRFNFTADPGNTVDGFLAHEAQAVVPECVTGEKDAVDADGNPIYQGIDQSKLVPLLTAALQEAVARIEAQDTTIASLEARLTALEGGN